MTNNCVVRCITIPVVAQGEGRGEGGWPNIWSPRNRLHGEVVGGGAVGVVE